MSVYAVAKLYNIPKTTITNHTSFKSKSFIVGRPTVFSEDEECFLVEDIVALAKIGFGLDIHNLQVIVKNVFVEMQKITPFKDPTPGLDCIYG
jgi:hypothetical protein